jgi:predicted ABC-type ATPase
MPNVIVIAGPNGAGKSTAAPGLLRDLLGVAEFVNADTIAAGLSGFNPSSVALQAGRLMLTRVRRLGAEGRDFAFETTLAAKSYAPWLKQLREQGYACCLVFLWLPSAEAAVARVQDRVRRGGHDIPEATIRRRYAAGLRNFFHLYRPLTDSWFFYDNSKDEGPRLIATGKGPATEFMLDPPLWRSMENSLAKE